MTLSYCLNCFHSYSTKNKLEKHCKVCKIHDFCYAEMPNECNKILKYNQGEKFVKVPFAIYVDVESLLEGIDTCHNNPEKSSTQKMNKHTPSGYLFFTKCSFDSTKNKLDCYRGKDFVRIEKICMKSFCKDLKEPSTEIINYEKRKKVPLNYEENKSSEKQKVLYMQKRI